jgi:hypothetical protein
MSYGEFFSLTCFGRTRVPLISGMNDRQYSVMLLVVGFELAVLRGKEVEVNGHCSILAPNFNKEFI